MESKLVIPGTFPTMNEIIKVSKSHPMRYSSMKKQYTSIVELHTKASKLPKMDRVDAVITWYCKDKRKDKDNITAGGTKMILDGLVKAGVLKNDGWKEIGDITHRFDVDKHNPRVEITLREVVANG